LKSPKSIFPVMLMASINPVNVNGEYTRNIYKEMWHFTKIPVDNLYACYFSQFSFILNRIYSIHHIHSQYSLSTFLWNYFGTETQNWCLYLKQECLCVFHFLP
jgi:hypothetical protein